MYGKEAKCANGDEVGFARHTRILREPRNLWRELGTGGGNEAPLLRIGAQPHNKLGITDIGVTQSQLIADKTLRFAYDRHGMVFCHCAAGQGVFPLAALAALATLNAP